MDRKHFLKAVCGLGVCGCVANVLAPPNVLADAQAETDQTIAFARYQVAHLARLLATSSAVGACTEILENTGRECAKLGALGARFKGDTAGYFAEARNAWGADFQWDKAKGIVTVGCPRTVRLPAGRHQAHAIVLVQLLGRLPEGVVLRGVRTPGAGVAEGVEAGGGKRCVFEVVVGSTR